MTQHPAQANRRRRRGFTLIEVLVVVGILVTLISILVPTINGARKRATRIRMASDLQAISTALEAYKSDFGDYPRVEYTPGITNAAKRPEPPTGAQVLCWALVGPAPIEEKPAPTAGQHAIQDGADGPGLRTRISHDTSGNAVGAGKVFGPYLPADKFHMANPQFPGDKNQDMLLWTLLDSNNKPILYAPASAKHLNPRDASPLPAAYIGQTSAASPVPSPLPATALQTFVWDLTDILGDPNTNAAVSADDAGTVSKIFTRPGDTQTMAAIYRVSAVLGDLTGPGGTGTPDGRISDAETPATTGPYLLWMAGPDGLFGPTPETNITAKDVSSSDDVTNFNQ